MINIVLSTLPSVKANCSLLVFPLKKQKTKNEASNTQPASHAHTPQSGKNRGKTALFNAWKEVRTATKEFYYLAPDWAARASTSATIRKALCQCPCWQLVLATDRPSGTPLTHHALVTPASTLVCRGGLAVPRSEDRWSSVVGKLLCTALKKKGGGLILSRPRFNPGSDTQPAHNLGPTQRRPRFNHNPYTQQSQVRPWVYRAGGQRSAVFYHTAGPRSTLVYYIQPAKVKL